MRSILAGLAALVLLAAPAAAQFSLAPTGGASLLILDGDVVQIGEVLADAGWQFPVNEEWWGEMVMVAGLNAEAGTIGGLGFRTYFQKGSVFPGFGILGFVVGDGDIDQLSETTIFIGPELLLEIPWATEFYDEETGEVLIEESKVTGFAGLYLPAAGDDCVDALVRFGIRANL